jgi:hypothetical protein
VISVCAAVVCGSVHADLEVLDRPIWIFPGQPFRICLRQPAGSGTLSVDVPESLELFDTWDQDAIQRFYFRATAPGSVVIRFAGKGGTHDLELDVLPWSDVFAPRAYKKVELPRTWPLGEPEFAQLKSRRTLHSDADIEDLKNNHTPSERAVRWHGMSDAAVFGIIPGPSVPRTCLIALGSLEGGAIGKGCPVCGTDIYKGRNGFYPWVFDREAHPWKVQCPSCKTLFPSNDWQNGDMHSGPFPDDGFGCEPLTPVKDANGRAWRWPFIAYYHQWECYMREFTPGILECARAGVATGDDEFIHKAAIGLFRYAESMLDMAVNLNHRKIPNRNGVYKWPVGAPEAKTVGRLRSSFLYIQPNWDTPRMENMARAWDLIFDKLEGDERLLEFCRAQYHPEIETLTDFRRFVDAGVMRVQIQACMDNAISRNYPQQETTAATLALALGTPRTMSIVDWLLNGTGIRFALSNQYYKDGSAHESPGYNGIQIRDMARLFRTLDRIRDLHPDLFVPPRFVSPMQDPTFRRQYDFPLEFSLIGRTYPMVGDTGKAGRPDPLPPAQGYPCKLDQWIDAYRLTGDPRFAQAMAGPNGRGLGSIDDPKLRGVAEQAVAKLGWQVRNPSNILDGYGHAILRSGDGDSQRALWLRYARCVQHSHVDMLTYGLAGMQRDLLPELGYPEGWTYSGHWEKNWGTHYGTHITGVRSHAFNKGELTTFAAGGPVQVAIAESRAGAAPDAPYRERVIVLVDLDADSFYALTVERVRGGTEHTVSFHGPDGEATPLNVELQPYEGTALGEGLAYGDFSPTKGNDPDLSCLALMAAPKRAVPQGVWGLDVALRGQDGIGLRMLSSNPEGCELTVARGRPPAGRALYDMPWTILRHRGESPLAGQYTTLVHPFAGSSRVDRVEALPVTATDADAEFEPLAFRVVCGDTVDTIVLQRKSGNELAAGGVVCDGTVGFWRETGERAAAMTLVRGTRLVKGDAGITMAEAEYTGRVTACDWSARTIRIEPVPARPLAWTGRHIRLHNENGSSASYQVEAMTVKDGSCQVTLGLDPRIGEGFVKNCSDGMLVSDTHLRLYPFRYYDGKTLANEDGTAVYRLAAVEKGSECTVVPADGTDTSAAALTTAFADRDGDGLPRVLIYDYGPGDTVTVENVASLRTQPER